MKYWTIKKQITTRSEKIVTSLNAAQATVVRDSVAKFVYACMFEWLVAIVNESLAGENGDAADKAEMFIGVLDIYGFEHFQKGALGIGAGEHHLRVHLGSVVEHNADRALLLNFNPRHRGRRLDLRAKLFRRRRQRIADRAHAAHHVSVKTLYLMFSAA